MKKLLILAVFLGFHLLSKCQNINLCNVLRDAYSNATGRFFIKDMKLNYVIPQSISFIDTSLCIGHEDNFEIKYFTNEKGFENYLKLSGDLEVLTVQFNEIKLGQLFLTIEINETNKKMYLDQKKFFIPRDKMKIKLVYRNSDSFWKFDSIIEAYNDFQK